MLSKMIDFSSGQIINAFPCKSHNNEKAISLRNGIDCRAPSMDTIKIIEIC